MDLATSGKKCRAARSKFLRTANLGSMVGEAESCPKLSADGPF
jgi:hypothetical protein